MFKLILAVLIIVCLIVVFSKPMEGYSSIQPYIPPSLLNQSGSNAPPMNKSSSLLGNSSTYSTYYHEGVNWLNGLMKRFNISL
jgi:hypothetical protein